MSTATEEQTTLFVEKIEDAYRPGLHFGITDEEYRTIPALNQSILKLMDERRGTPLHAKAVYDGLMPDKDSDALRFGRAAHSWILDGPAEFHRRNDVATTCRAVKGNGQICGGTAKNVSYTPSNDDDVRRIVDQAMHEHGWHQGEISRSGSTYYHKGLKTCRLADHDPVRPVDIDLRYYNDIYEQLSEHGLTVQDKPKFWYCGVKSHAPADSTQPSSFVTPDEMDSAKAMGDAVRRHDIGVHLKRPGWSEATIVYDVAVRYPVRVTTPRLHVEKHETLLRHKVRLDRIGKPVGNKPWIVLDLKKMPVNRGLRLDRERTILDYGWDVQAAMYTEAVMRHYGASRCDFVWLFVEENYPYDVVWFPASTETLRIGRDKLWRYRKQWATCMHNDSWPGRCTGPQEPGGLPKGYVSWYTSPEGYGDDFGNLLGDSYDERL